MTTPKVRTIKRGGSRYYVNPETGAKTPGVTSILSMLPKPFLRYWAAKMVAEEAVENLGAVVSIALKDPAGAVDYLKRAPDRNTKEAADIGSEAHDLFERLAKGESVGRVHPDLAPFVEHFEEFLALCEPEFIFLEETVWSDEDGYAGSFDALATLHGEGAGPLQGKTLFFDWKTTRSGVHEEVALQLSGYRHASHIIRPDGSRVPLPKVDGGAVLHVRPEGWALYPVETGLLDLPTGDTVELMDYLRALRMVFDWEDVVKHSVIGRPVVGGGEFAPEVQTRGSKINRPRRRAAR